MEEFQQHGERVISEFPHPNIHPLIPKVFETAHPGDQHRVPISKQLVYLRLEQAEYRNGNYEEVATAAKDRLAIINEDRIVNVLLVQHEPSTQVERK